MPPTMMSPGFLPAFCRISGELAGDAAVLAADGLQVRVRLDVGGQHRHREGGIGVDFLAHLQAVDLQAGLLERVGETLLGLAALGLVEHAVDHRLVARLQAVGEHGLGGQRATGIEVDAGIAEALRAEFVLQLAQGRVAAGDDDALIDGALDQVMEGRASRGGP